MVEIRVSPLRLEEAEALVELAERVWRAHYPAIISAQQIEYMETYLKHGFTVATLVLEEIGGGFVMDDYVMTRDL